MDETIQKVDYYYVTTANKVGEGTRLLKALREGGVNLLAFSGFPSGRRAQIDFIPENVALFKAIAKKAGFQLSGKKSGFLVQGEDRLGAIEEVTAKLADFKINITAIDAVSAGGGRYGAILWVQPSDVNKAAKVLGVGAKRVV